MSIYTRTGDDGTTGLLGGVRVKKTDAHIEALGALDELNASIGLSICMIPRTLGKQMNQELTDVQNNLFSIGSHCATLSKTQLRIHARTTGFPAPRIHLNRLLMMLLHLKKLSIDTIPSLLRCLDLSYPEGHQKQRNSTSRAVYAGVQNVASVRSKQTKSL